MQRLQKPSRLIRGFAILGLIVTLFFALCQFADGPSTVAQSNTLEVLTFLLCPASLLAMPFAVNYFGAVETGTFGFYVMWSIIGMINGGIYTLFGTWFAYSRQDVH
jgi:hypothetical protein